MDKKQALLKPEEVGYTASIFFLFKLVASKLIPKIAIEIAINQFNGFEFENKIQRNIKSVFSW